MTASDLIGQRKRRVAARFGRQAGDYEQNAQLQRRVAETLARLLPALTGPRVLEIGCGTGFLTRHLLAAYPDGAFTVTDLSPGMLAACAANLGQRTNIRFELMDGERPPANAAFDLIATSMTLQWFEDPLASLERLRRCLAPGGRLVYAAIGPNLFPEWRVALADLDLPCGLLDMPVLPGTIAEEAEAARFADGIAFLDNLRAMGAAEPRPGYRQLGPGELRRALARWQRTSGGTASWHIVYGALGA